MGVERAALRPLLDARVFAVTEIGAAHAHLSSGKALGKVVVDGFAGDE